MFRNRHLGVAAAVFLVVWSFRPGPAQGAMTRVHVRLDQPWQDAGMFYVPLNYRWESDSTEYRLARLILDFSATSGQLTNGGKDYGKLTVIAPPNIGWSLEKPLGQTMDYSFKHGSGSFEGTWWPHQLVLKNDTDWGQIIPESSGGMTAMQDLGRLGDWLSDPWTIAGTLATAVAVPVAIHNTHGASANGDYLPDDSEVTEDPAEQFVGPDLPPEPSTLALLLGGAACLHKRRRLKRR